MSLAEEPRARMRDRTEGEMRIPSLLQCALGIFAVKVALATRGFAWTMNRLAREMKAVRTTTMVSLRTVRAAERGVALAGALYPGRARCLEQSLTLYYLLRRKGVPVRYCQGVQSHPFQAHAWVEYEGEIINDVPEHIKAFSRLPGQLP